LVESAPLERKAQAMQLKAYLMFYDQLLANHFAQLAEVGRLFSFHDATPDSYFSQALQDDGVLELIRDVRVPADLDKHRALLQQITEDPELEKSGNERGARWRASASISTSSPCCGRRRLRRATRRPRSSSRITSGPSCATIRASASTAARRSTISSRPAKTIFLDWS
jgi:hypothetical protein